MTQHTPPVRKATANDLEPLVATLTSAFFNDPVCASLFPKMTSREQRLSSFFTVYTLAALAESECHVYQTGNHSAVLLGFPPENSDAVDDTDSNEDLISEWAEHCGAEAGPAAEAIRLMKHNTPSTPHLYVFAVASRPDVQSRGLGSSLFTTLTQYLDVTCLPAYLEATTIRSAALYSRFGFVLHPQGAYDLPTGPQVYPMWREPT